MPRDAVAITPLSPDVAVAPPAGTTINVTNGAVINGAGDTKRILVRMTNTAGVPKNITFKAGVNPPAVRKGLGDLIVAVPATTGERLVVIESARFAQADGSINIDFEAATAGIVSAVRLPK
jgi:hypothetical protein